MNGDQVEKIRRTLNIQIKNPFSTYKFLTGPSRLSITHTPLLPALEEYSSQTLCSSFLDLEEELKYEERSEDLLCPASSLSIASNEGKEEDLGEDYSRAALQHIQHITQIREKYAEHKMKTRFSIYQSHQLLESYSSIDESEKECRSIPSNASLERANTFFSMKGRRSAFGSMGDPLSLLQITEKEEPNGEIGCEELGLNSNKRILKVEKIWGMRDLDHFYQDQQIETLSLLKQAIERNNIGEVDCLDMPNPRRKTYFNQILILDMDDTMLHVSANDIPHYNAPDYISTNHKYAIYIRPYLFHFLEYMHIHFELVLYSSAEDQYVAEIIDSIHGFPQFFDLVLSRKNCIKLKSTQAEIYAKCTRVIRNRSHVKTIIIDDRISSWFDDYDNIIPITPFSPEPFHLNPSAIHKSILTDSPDMMGIKDCALLKIKNLVVNIVNSKETVKKALKKKFRIGEMIKHYDKLEKKEIIYTGNKNKICTP